MEKRTERDSREEDKAVAKSCCLSKSKKERSYIQYEREQLNDKEGSVNV